MSDFVTLQNRVLDATLRGDDGSANGNRAQIGNDINEAIHQVDALLRPQLSSTVKVITMGQANYSLSTDFGLTGLTGIRDIVYQGQTSSQPWTLAETTPALIREMRQTFTNSNYINLYAIDGLDQLLLYPTTQSVGDTITIYYITRSADLVNPTDVPTGLPEEFHEIYEIAAIQRSMRQSSPEYAAQYTQMYEHKLGEYRKWKNKRGGARPRRSVVGRYGRRMIPRDNSTDWRY